MSAVFFASGDIVQVGEETLAALKEAAGYLAVIAAGTVCGTSISWRSREKWHRAMTP